MNNKDNQKLIKALNKKMKEAYNILQSSLKFQQDEMQLQLIKLFESYKVLIEHQDTSIISKIFNNKKEVFNHKKQGIYIWGGVGRGKSMLMNLFYENLITKRKNIIHFHKFMLDFHYQFNRLQNTNSISQKDYDPIPMITNEMTQNYQTICLDELQVNNIADAMVLLRIFNTMLQKGTFIFITSNFPPERLFEEGLQRERFLPFIDLIQEYLDIFKLENLQDYRLRKMHEIKKLYYFPLNQITSDKIHYAIKELIGNHKLTSRTIISYEGKKLTILRSYGQIVVFDFYELCKMPLGAIDYIAICKNFSVIIIENIPKMEDDAHNEALRFITLIDTMYDFGTKLICSAAVEIKALYSGKKHKLEFSRLISRMHEMQTNDYHNKEMRMSENE